MCNWVLLRLENLHFILARTPLWLKKIFQMCYSAFLLRFKAIYACPSLRMVLGVCGSTEFLQDTGNCPVCPVSSCGLVRVHLLQPEPCSLPLRCICSHGWKTTKLCLHWGKQAEIHNSMPTMWPGEIETHAKTIKEIRIWTERYKPWLSCLLSRLSPLDGVLRQHSLPLRLRLLNSVQDTGFQLLLPGAPSPDWRLQPAVQRHVGYPHHS